MKLRLRNNKYKGNLIVFEGTDGAGKTTLIHLTTDYLNELQGNATVLVVKQPTDLSRKTKLFQKMMYCEDHKDIDYRAVQLLTMSDRIQHGFEIIEPALRSGKTVICDRYIYTSLANMLARGYTKERWFFEAANNLLEPTIVFLAHASPKKAIMRIKSRPEECNRYLDEGLLTKVSNEFLKMAKRESFKVLDTNGEAETAFRKIKTVLEKEGVT